ncbi:MAG TPA: hypothetical protein V6C86_24455 [Oculatellaceae cyanobacterium]
MLKKLATSFTLASALVSTLVAPSLADDESTFQSIVNCPVRCVGATVGGTVGVPLGALKDGVKGWMKASKSVAGGLGNEDGQVQTIAGNTFGGPCGFVVLGTYGIWDGLVHGVKTGYKQPFTKEAFTFKDE